MENATRVMASIGSALLPVGIAQCTAIGYIHQRLVDAQTTPLYSSLESTLIHANGFADPDRLTLAGTALATLAVSAVAYEVARPVVKCFAYLYDAKLE